MKIPELINKLLEVYEYTDEVFVETEGCVLKDIGWIELNHFEGEVFSAIIRLEDIDA